MKNRNPLVLTSSFFLFLIIAITSCKKINEPTELGSDLIPVVDNINTFADTLDVQVFNEEFTNVNDSIRIAFDQIQYMGRISNDPLFGQTTASMFLELKPNDYPFSFGSGNNFQIDSVVLVLSYKETYGDTTVSQKVNVFQLDASNNFKADSSYLIRSNTLAYSNTNLIGSKTFLPKELNDSVFAFREKAANQLRIRLDDAFGQSLLNKNSTDVYSTDDKFKAFLKGFAVVPDEAAGGNAVMGFQLTDSNSKLAVYYNFRNASNTVVDTVSMFRFRTDSSAAANLVKREYNGSESYTYLHNDATTPDEYGYIQNTPGTYVRVKIPELATLSNRVIHRAELVVQQVYHPLDELFTASPTLFMDALIPDSDINTENDKYEAIPFTATPNADGTLNFDALEPTAKKRFDAGGKSINVWRLNVSRYVQNVVNKREPAVDFRIYSPFYARLLFTESAAFHSLAQVNPTSTKYRVRVGGGNHPTQRMLLRIVYSNIP